MSEKDLYECWNCGKDFDRRQTSQTTCDHCRKCDDKKKASRALNRYGSVCYQRIPGHWSPMSVDGQAISDLGDGYLNVLCEDGICRKVHIGSFSVFVNQTKKQLSLF